MFEHLALAIVVALAYRGPMTTAVRAAYAIATSLGDTSAAAQRARWRHAASAAGAVVAALGVHRRLAQPPKF